MQPLSYSLQMPFLWLVMSSHDPMPLSWCRMTILITWNHIFVYHFTFVESRVTTDTPNTSHSANVACTSHFQTSKLMFFMLFISQYPAKVSSASLYGLASQLRTRVCMHATHCSSHTDFGVIPQDMSVHLSCTGDVGAGWFRVSSGIYVPSRRAQATWGRR